MSTDRKIEIMGSNFQITKEQAETARRRMNERGVELQMDGADDELDANSKAKRDLRRVEYGERSDVPRETIEICLRQLEQRRDSSYPGKMIEDDSGVDALCETFAEKLSRDQSSKQSLNGCASKSIGFEVSDEQYTRLSKLKNERGYTWKGLMLEGAKQLESDESSDTTD